MELRAAMFFKKKGDDPGTLGNGQSEVTGRIQEDAWPCEPYQHRTRGCLHARSNSILPWRLS